MRVDRRVERDVLMVSRIDGWEVWRNLLVPGCFDNWSAAAWILVDHLFRIGMR